MSREVILDTETTGLDHRRGDRIIEIGALEMKNKVLTGAKFSCYLNPERDVSYEAYKVHGLSTEFLLDKPLFIDVANDFLEFIEGAKLVIHNAPFDIGFLNSELNLVKLPLLDLAEAIDTLKIARKKFPGSKVNLDALCRRFKVDNSKREEHGAIIDAQLLSEVYVELMGGRQSSFAITKEQHNILTEQSSLQNNMKGNNIVIMPTEKEEDLHKLLMKKVLN